MRVWFHAAVRRGHPDAGDTARALESLARAGIELCPLDAGHAPGPGLILFDRLTPETYELVREASRAGLERVLAVAMDGAALADGEGWSLLQLGASDVLAWDRSPDAAAQIAARFERWNAVDRLVASPLVQKNLIGSSPAWMRVLRQVVEVAHFTDASVLILGESGTGKELIARLIHSLDARPRKGELVVLDCATVVPELAGSEFFGHERGAFTGAVGQREGAFALADGGTLFLDEIGELTPPMQALLLRAIQERTYKRVGGNTWHATRFRLVCATHRPLDAEIASGGFRADLYYRIGAVVCRVPPLRDRPEDVLLLFRHFVAQYAGTGEPPNLDEAVERLLLSRRYPGNVRELQQLAKRTSCRHVGPGPITMGDIPEDERPRGAEDARVDIPFDACVRRALACGLGLKEIGRLAAETAIRIAVGDAEGNLQQAARRLGVTDRALQMRRAAGWRSATAGRAALAEPVGSNGAPAESPRGSALPRTPPFTE
ncbi:MAG TPA: sigma 54-interacting transcriptional regulator [Longimicrobiales bacterium]